MIRVANILDIPKIITLFYNVYTPSQLEGVELYLSVKLKRGKEHLCLLSEDDSMVMVAERVDNYKCQFHIYSNLDSRGKKAKEFFKECIQYLLDNTNYTYFFTFIPEEFSYLKLMAKHAGMHLVSKLLESGSGESSEYMYSINKSEFLERYELCQ